MKDFDAENNYVSLSNGVKMPVFGLGTTHNGGYNHEAVVYALAECGYRLIDTAKRYGTEAFIGQAVLDSGLDRESQCIQIFEKKIRFLVQV